MALKTVDLTQQPHRVEFTGCSEDEISYAKTFWQSLQLLPPMESRLVSSDIKQRLRKAPPSRSQSESDGEFKCNGYCESFSFTLSNTSSTPGEDLPHLLYQHKDEDSSYVQLCSNKPDRYSDLSFDNDFLKVGARQKQSGNQRNGTHASRCNGGRKDFWYTYEENAMGDPDYVIYELSGEDLSRGRKWRLQNKTQPRQQPEEFIEFGGEDLCRHHGRLSGGTSKATASKLLIMETGPNKTTTKKAVVSMDHFPAPPPPSLTCSYKHLSGENRMDSDVDAQHQSSAITKTLMGLNFAAQVGKKLQEETSTSGFQKSTLLGDQSFQGTDAQHRPATVTKALLRQGFATKNFRSHIGKKMQEEETRTNGFEKSTLLEDQSFLGTVANKIGVQRKAKEPLLLFIPGNYTSRQTVSEDSSLQFFFARAKTMEQIEELKKYHKFASARAEDRALLQKHRAERLKKEEISRRSHLLSSTSQETAASGSLSIIDNEEDTFDPNFDDNSLVVEEEIRKFEKMKGAEDEDDSD